MFKLALSLSSHHCLYKKKNCFAYTGDGDAASELAVDTNNFAAVGHGEILNDRVAVN